MRDDYKGTAGLTGVVLLGALAVGAAGPDVRVDDVTTQEPAQTAVFNASQPQTVSTESVDPTPPNDSESPAAKVAVECAGIVVKATELVFSDSFETADTSAWGRGALARFSAIRMLDLDLTVRFVDAFSGDHLLHLKLFTPKGHHYQTLSMWIASAPEHSKSLRRVEGYPRPLAVRPVHKAGYPGLPEVTLSVPVGGTPIVTSSIYGMWTAEAYLDDQSEACASQPFVLTP